MSAPIAFTSFFMADPKAVGLWLSANCPNTVYETHQSDNRILIAFGNDDEEMLCRMRWPVTLWKNAFDMGKPVYYEDAGEMARYASSFDTAMAEAVEFTDYDVEWTDPHTPWL